MITLEIKGGDMWDEAKEEFITIEPVTLELEHSLISLSKWEAKHKKSFIKESEAKRLSREENLDYFRCMSIHPIKNPNVFYAMSIQDEQRLLNYIADSMTATTFNDHTPEGVAKRRKRREVITSEIIYYWMVELGIPFECEKWHLNRLLTLVRVCQEKQATPKKMKKKDVLGMYAAENAKRKAALGTRG